MDIFSIIGPIMIGPSSSHTAGACKIGNIAVLLLGGKPVKAEITLYGSFAKTGVGHGTDKAVIAGVLGFKSDDTRIKNSFDYAKDMGLDYSFESDDKIGIHPNTARISLWDADDRKISIEGVSIGGGRVNVIAVNDFEASFSGENHTTIVVHQDRPGVIANVTKTLANENVNIAKMSMHRAKRGGVAALIIESDQAPTVDSIKEINENSLVQRIYSVPKI